MAKHIIHLINAVGSVVNDDPRVEGRLKVLFPPNYNVTLAERVIPAADLSEQISLAGKEASGTGNMKFALNGALTIGTDDGANVEIRELVGDDNFFLFGMSEPEVEALWARGLQARRRSTRPTTTCAARSTSSRPGAFSGGDRSTFEPIVSNLLYDDRFMVLADYSSYIDGAGEGGRRVRRPRRVDAVRDPQRRPLRASSPPTGRCATTSTASGTRRRRSEPQRARSARRNCAGSGSGATPPHGAPPRG